MSFKNVAGLLVSAVITLGWTQAGHAVEVMSTAELKSHCDLFDDPNAEADRIFCTRYVQGFIDGAVAPGPAHLPWKVHCDQQTSRDPAAPCE